MMEWAQFFNKSGKDLEHAIINNVMRHVFKFTAEYNIAKQTWAAGSYWWTGEKMGTMLVQATQSKNILYADEVENGWEVDFEGESFILQ